MKKFLFIFCGYAALGICALVYSGSPDAVTRNKNGVGKTKASETVEESGSNDSSINFAVSQVK